MEKKVLGKGLSALIARNNSDKSSSREISSLDNNQAGNVSFVKTTSIL